MKYEFKDWMREISVFGGSYEEACRTMVLRCVNWFDEHPNEKANLSTFKSVNDIEKEYPQVIEEVCHDIEPSGDMFNTSMAHAFFIVTNDWDFYVSKMTDPEKVKELRKDKINTILQ